MLKNKELVTGLDVYQDKDGDIRLWEPHDNEIALDKPVLTQGVKYDSNKPEYSLLPPVALLEMVKNLTFGAQKYTRENWRKVPDAKRRYFDAAQRHMWQWKMQETNDPENNLHHLAAAAVNLMFILELDLLEEDQP